MENKITRTRLRKKLPFGTDIYMKLYMGDDSVIYFIAFNKIIAMNE